MKRITFSIPVPSMSDIKRTYRETRHTVQYKLAAALLNAGVAVCPHDVVVMDTAEVGVRYSDEV